MENSEKKQDSLSLVGSWIQVKYKVKKLVIEHSARLKQENSDIENNLKQQLEQKRQNVTINELIDDGGISKTSPIDLAEHVQKF